MDKKYTMTIKLEKMSFKKKCISVYNYARAIFFNTKDNRWAGDAESITIDKINPLPKEKNQAFRNNRKAKIKKKKK